MARIMTPHDKYENSYIVFLSAGLPLEQIRVLIDSCGIMIPIFVRPEKWDDFQVGFRGSNASGGRSVLLPGAFWAYGASKMATLGASLLLCILQCFRAWEGMLPPGACRTSRPCASVRRIVSCKGVCAVPPNPT